MSQLSPYMPLCIVPVLPCLPDLYPMRLLNIQNSKQHLAYTYPRRR